GYRPEFHIYDMGHGISPEVLNDLVLWLTGVLPPLTKPTYGAKNQAV
ncbi:MAG: hypothetical protein IIB89_13100, partial [Chloroflexi bacterium]|nr:hypothetical protein [Chloroflexota bacterium]